METKIIACTCIHPWQDATYGPTRRVHNAKAPEKGSNRQKWRCTVCSTTRE